MPRSKAKSKARRRPLPRRLLVVAHPDDETLFFSSVLQTRSTDLRVVCVTDGNADGQGTERARQFEQAVRLQGPIACELWGLPDIYERRLDLDEIDRRLNAVWMEGKIAEVYTHGPVGEYGHPHHQDVCFAVYRFFSARGVPVHSPAYNALPDRVHRLTNSQFQKKSQAIIDVYRGETARFLHLLSNVAVEGFVRPSFKEVSAIYETIACQRPLDLAALKVWKWYAPHLCDFHAKPMERPF